MFPIDLHRIPASTRAITCVFLIYSMLAPKICTASDENQALVSTGRKLVTEAKCEACHSSKLGGDGTAMYLRPDRRVKNKNGLLAQVARCNNELSLGLFPDDEAAIAAYLNATHYKLKN
jgi:hypothetical protein